MSDQDTKLNDNIADLIGLGGLSDDEKVAFLSEIGDVVLESAMLRLVGDLSEDQTEALDQFLETEPEPEVLMKHLFEHHKDFETILEEEIAALREETKAVLGPVSETAGVK